MKDVEDNKISTESKMWLTAYAVIILVICVFSFLSYCKMNDREAKKEIIQTIVDSNEYVVLEIDSATYHKILNGDTVKIDITNSKIQNFKTK